MLNVKILNKMKLKNDEDRRREAAESALRKRCEDHPSYGNLSLHSAKEFSNYRGQGIPVVCKNCEKTFYVTNRTGNSRAIDTAQYQLRDPHSDRYSRHSVIILRCECPDCRQNGKKGFGYAAYD